MASSSRLCLAVAAGALLLASCAGTGFRYVKSSETNTYFKVPQEWRLFEEDEIFEHGGSRISPQQQEAAKRGQWIVAFDADPEPSLSHLLESTATNPSGFAKVRVLSDRERETYSLSSLRNSVYPIDTLEDQGQEVEVLSSEDVVTDGGLRGIRIVYNLEQDERFLTVNQTSLVDPSTRLLYVFAIGCEANCYVQNEEVIEEVVDSWTVKER